MFLPELATGWVLLPIAILCYLIGSIPFGMVYTRVFGLGDLRKLGSGNIGATNVLRTGHRPAAALTLISDAGKGAVAVVLARSLWADDAAQLAALCAFVGHLFPVWLGFKGGKGVATFLGVLLALQFVIGLIICTIWLAVAFVFRMSSLSALVSVTLAPIWLILIDAPQFSACVAVMAAMVWFRHGANIRRIFAGTEPRIGRS